MQYICNHIRVLILFPLLVQNLPVLSIAQSIAPNKKDFRYHIPKTDETLSIDGILDEEVWQRVPVAEEFYRILPIDTGFSQAQTHVRMCYDENNIYLSVVCDDPWPGKRPVESLRRDFSFGNNENFIVFIDTYDDQTNGFAFGVSSAGAQWEGQQANGGFVSLDWDGKWRSAVSNLPDQWIAEFAIPFRTIRYRVGISEWGINFSRLDLKGNEKSSWAPMPRQFQTANLAYAGTLVWDQPPPDLGLRYSLIPYVSGKLTKDKSPDANSEWSPDAGMDAKITLSTSMNLDLTLNPDFSQVEVDRQVINLDRFELFFPEKRQFFLENSDLFASLGRDNIRPFFSRRIGLTNPVIAGARLSGQAGNDWRIGVMNLQTRTEDNEPAANFTVGTLQRKVWQNSNLSLFAVNKELTGSVSDPSDPQNEYNRVFGVDFNLATSDNSWTGKAFYHHSFTSGESKNNYAASASVIYQTQQLTLEWTQNLVGEGYSAETGFIQRTGYHQIDPMAQYKFYPTSKSIANHGPAAGMNLYYDPDGNLTDRWVGIGYQMEWLNRSSLVFMLNSNYIRLLQPFDPTNTGGELLPAGESFDWHNAEINYLSDARKLFHFSITGSIGGYYNGNQQALELILNYRVQPWGNFSIVTNYARISLPSPYEDAELVLIGPRLDLTFTDKLFLTTFVQYNNQIDNLNINTKVQWRFAPVSDFFLVYTLNAFPDNLNAKDRSLVAKLSYWFN